MKKFLTTLAVLTACATPAFAQSFDPDNGTGNVLSFAHTPTAPHDQKTTQRQSGLHSFAMVPARNAPHLLSPTKKTGLLWLALFSVCMAGNSRVLRNVAETMKDRDQ
jgi:hypothetical protein